MKKIIFIHTSESTGNMLASDLHTLHRLKSLTRYRTFVGILCYCSKYSIVSLKAMVSNRYQNGLVVMSKAIAESDLLKKYSNVKTIVLK